MKARLKATGEYIEVVPSIYNKGSYYGNDGYTYTEESLIMLENEPDYWEKLKHQAAIAAMQGIMANQDLIVSIVRKRSLDEPIKLGISDLAIQVATALVNKLKEEQK